MYLTFSEYAALFREDPDPRPYIRAAAAVLLAAAVAFLLFLFAL